MLLVTCWKEWKIWRLVSASHRSISKPTPGCFAVIPIKNHRHRHRHRHPKPLSDSHWHLSKEITVCSLASNAVCKASPVTAQPRNQKKTVTTSMNHINTRKISTLLNNLQKSKNHHIRITSRKLKSRKLKRTHLKFYNDRSCRNFMWEVDIAISECNAVGRKFPPWQVRLTNSEPKSHKKAEIATKNVEAYRLL